MTAKHTWTVPTVSVDKDGNSFFTEFTLQMHNTDGDTNSIGALTESFGSASVMFRETPANYCYDYHVAPRRQFVINLDNSVEIETSLGVKKVLPPGCVFFVEDLWGKGHRSKSINDKPRRSVFIAVPDSFKPAGL